MYQPGRQELVVGAAALRQFDGVQIGDNVRLQEGDWTVVGVFAGTEGLRESEVIADVRTGDVRLQAQCFPQCDGRCSTTQLRSPRSSNG